MVFIQPPISALLSEASKRRSRSAVADLAAGAAGAPSELELKSPASNSEPVEMTRRMPPSLTYKRKRPKNVLFLPALWGKVAPCCPPQAEGPEGGVSEWNYAFP